MFTPTKCSQSARAMTTHSRSRARASHRCEAGGQEGIALPFFHAPVTFPETAEGAEPKPGPLAPKISLSARCPPPILHRQSI